MIKIQIYVILVEGMGKQLSKQRNITKKKIFLLPSVSSWKNFNI